jgi:hypothetical protein
MGKPSDVSTEQTEARPKSAPRTSITRAPRLSTAPQSVSSFEAQGAAVFRRRHLRRAKPITHPELLAAVKDHLAHRCSPPQIGVLRGEFVSLAADHPTASAQTDLSEQAAPTRSELAHR